MKLCEKEGCETQIDDKYRFCYVHYEAPNKIKAKIPSDAWNDDPTIDILMKLNANLGKIAKTLENIEYLIGEKK